MLHKPASGLRPTTRRGMQHRDIPASPRPRAFLPGRPGSPKRRLQEEQAGKEIERLSECLVGEVVQKTCAHYEFYCP
jgi:hypothetical protein